MENNIPSEPLNERNMRTRENVLLCDKCCGENVKPSQFCPTSGSRSIVQCRQLDHRNPRMRVDTKRIQEDYQKCTRSHGIFPTSRSTQMDPGSSCVSDNRKGIQADYPKCTMKGNRGNLQEDYPKSSEGHGLHSTSAYSSKCSADLQCTCKITQSWESISGLDKDLSIHLSRFKCSQTRPLTKSNPTVINHVNAQKEMDSIRQITYNRKEDTLPHSSPTLAHTQDRYIHDKSDELKVFQLSDTEHLSHESEEFTQKFCDKQAFQASSKCSSAIPMCTLVNSETTCVPPFQHKISKQQQSLPSQCNPSGTNPALFLYHSAVTLLKRTRPSCIFRNYLLILLFMFTLLPLPTHSATNSATNGIPCLYKGSLKSDRSWFGFLTNITIMNTGRMTFQFSYPAEKCCQNILFYLEDQVSILNARMNCWQKESLLR